MSAPKMTTELRGLSSSASMTLARVLQKMAPIRKRTDIALPKDLREYCSQAWPTIEPSHEFVPNWHLDCICEHLEAVTKGELRNLLVNMPPRSGKSSLISVLWPTYSWTIKPGLQWLCASYAESLSTRDAVRSRRLIRSPWYQERYGHLFALAGDQNVKGRYDNTKNGYRIATSVGGTVTGEGGDVIDIDDPHNVRMAESPAMRESVLTWYDEVISTRPNDPKTSAKVIVMQRVHEQDLTGHLLEKGGYHHLCLPARYEPRVYGEGYDFTQKADSSLDAVPQPHDDCPIYEDPRTIEGQLLWPERQGEKELLVLEADMGPYAASGQLQQRPVPRLGAVFESSWFRPIPPQGMGTGLLKVMYWDLAWSERQMADYTAACTVGLDPDENLYILNMHKFRASQAPIVGTSPTSEELAPVLLGDGWPVAPGGRLEVAIADHIALMRPAVVGVEVGAYKQQVTLNLIRNVNVLLARRGVVTMVKPVKVDTDKVTRAQIPAGRARAGQVFVDTAAPWWFEAVKEILTFPKGPHDDLVDALSGACQMAIEQSWLRATSKAGRQSYQIGESRTQTDVKWDWASEERTISSRRMN